jgi:murein DD-endopeptidase MepM/ murein hydrolase activator NlpD
MRKLYYYSKSDLSFKAIGGGRLSLMIVSLVLISSFVTMLSGYLGVDLFGLKSLRADSMARENSVLKAQLASLNRRLDSFQLTMKSLGSSDNQLRTSVNLPAIPAETRMVAIGGVAENTDYGVSPDANNLLANATKTLDALGRVASLQEDSYADILQKYKSNQQLFAHIPAIDPIRGGIISDGFGMRFHPILHMRLMHEGIDLVADVGTHVHATGDGVVSYVGQRGGYGNVVEINHGFGFSTVYGHLEKALVREGQKVKRGQVIALSGDTGLSTGPHLHYEVIKNGVHVNPTAYFFNGREYNEAGFYSELASK